MDVSADLTELGRTPVALVTSGELVGYILADNPTVNVEKGLPTMLECCRVGSRRHGINTQTLLNCGW